MESLALILFHALTYALVFVAITFAAVVAITCAQDWRHRAMMRRYK